MHVQLDPLQVRIVAILKDWYPITTEELRDELGLRKDTLDRALIGLAAKGLIALEPLPDKTYIRLLVPDIEVTVDKKRAKRSKRRPKPPERPDDTYMYT